MGIFWWSTDESGVGQQGDLRDGPAGYQAWRAIAQATIDFISYPSHLSRTFKTLCVALLPLIPSAMGESPSESYYFYRPACPATMMG